MTRYCGRDFSCKELERIRKLIAAHPDSSRTRLSQQVCELLDWKKPDGGLKEMSCRVAMLRMHRNQLIVLPPPRRQPTRAVIRFTDSTAPQTPIRAPLHELSTPQLRRVSTPADSRLWNEYIERYHYLGYKPLPGAQQRYFAAIDRQIVAAFGFGAAAWKTAPRDDFIGWNRERREANLALIVNNARFLILPWINCPNLASHLLARLARELPQQWYDRYRIRPVLLETFVEQRFLGTCYRAANWINVGQTKGLGKCAASAKPTLPIKDIWLYPLCRDFRKILNS